MRQNRAGNAVWIAAALVCWSAMRVGPAVGAPPTTPTTAPATAKVDFARDIRPIFADNCYKCHGAIKHKSGLRLDRRTDAMHGGDSGAVITPGKADQSLLIQMVSGADPLLEVMPPKGQRLSKQQIALLKRWIDQGAAWPDALAGDAATSTHWAFQKVKRPALPRVKQADWPRNGIDHFVLAKLESKGIKPSPPADRYTLIRRVYLDLLGLPPTPQQVDAFVNDTRPDAYNRIVDEALKSPHYGERWGRHWLDQARYADSHGYAIDGDRTMWPWRDWVINALNKDMPFDQFTVEQLAGDLMTNATTDQLVATGFHRNTLINQEGGTKADQFRVEEAKDRVATTGQVWLGLTIGCTQCHNHPFDPLTQREFYEFFAFFNSTADANNTGPTVRIETPQQKQQFASVRNQIAAAEKALANYDTAAVAARRQWERRIGQVKPPQWSVVRPAAVRSVKGASLKTLADGSILAGGENKPHDVYEVDGPPAVALKRISAVRLDLLPDDSLPGGGPGRAGNGNIVLSAFELHIGDRAVKFASATASHEQDGYPIAYAIDGKQTTGWAINGGGKDHPINGTHHAVFVLAEPVDIGDGQTLQFTLRHERPDNPSYQIGRFKLSVTASSTVGVKSPASPQLAKAVATPEAKRSKQQRDLIIAEFRKQDARRAALAAKVAELKKRESGLARSVPSVMVMRELPDPRQTHVQIRGDFLRPADPVQPGVPQVLPPLPAKPANGQRYTRLDLARWLVSPHNPLTARVTINRIWMRYLGKGLVQTEEDFGTRGTPPTHPKLLDWLASEFVRQGWSLKAMHRLIVTSATYRQSSNIRPQLAELDAANRLLARQNRLRVEAEIVRDLALAVSGLLSEKIGGPSVRPPQPDGVYNFTQNRKSWKADTGENRYRRGMYIFFYRSAPYPMLTTFDVPNLNTTCTHRLRSNTPLQSLTLANGQAMFELAQGLAARVLREAPASQGGAVRDGDASAEPRDTDRARMTRAFRLCLARPPAAYELNRLMRFQQLQLKRFKADADAAKHVAPTQRPAGVGDAEAAAWVAVARALINLDEFITRE